MRYSTLLFLTGCEVLSQLTMPQEVSNPGYSCHMAAKNLRDLKCVDADGRDMLHIDRDGRDYEARCRDKIMSGEWVGTLCVARAFSCVRVRTCNVKTTTALEDVQF